MDFEPMDSRLREQLAKIDEHITRLFRVEHEFLLLDGNKKGLLASMIMEAQGRSHAERETIALASESWRNFTMGLSVKEAEFNREKRRYELLLKAFDSCYIEYKVEATAIRRQL